MPDTDYDMTDYDMTHEQLHLLNNDHFSDESADVPLPATSNDINVGRRQIKPDWFKMFPWLLLEGNKFYCKICIEGKVDNVFTVGKDCNQPKKDFIRKHGTSKIHERAEENIQGKKNLIRATKKSYKVYEECFIAQMRTVLVQAQEAIPSSKNTALLKLQALNGANAVRPLLSENVYQHNESLQDVYMALAGTVQDELNAQLKCGPYQKFSLEADEATDCSSNSIVVVCIRFVNANCEIETKYLGVGELESTDSESIFNSVKNIRDINKLNPVDMVGLATDGASVMLGIHKGVAARFKKESPQIVATHCMAHRLALASEKAANKVPYLVKYIGVVNQFAKILKYSPKLKRSIETCKSVTGEKANKVVQIFFTRWLSFSKSVNALADCICAVISSLVANAAERTGEGRAIMHGLCSYMASTDFVLMTHFLADSMSILEKLSLTIQKDSVMYSTVISQIHASITALKKLTQSPGEKMLKAFAELGHLDGIEVTYRGHKVKDSVKKREKMQTACEQFIEQVVAHLEFTFPENSGNVLESFNVFTPCIMNVCMSEEQGLAAVKHLANHFLGSGKVAEAVQEWDLLKHILKLEKFASLSMSQFMKVFLHANRETYPVLSQLVVTGMVLPVTSVSCERAISAYNAIKTDSRNQLKTVTVNSLMALYLHSKPVEEFDFHTAYDKWLNTKDRRGLIKLAKSMK